MCRCREVSNFGIHNLSTPTYTNSLYLSGVPVATVGINNSINAALLAARILGSFDPAIQAKVESFAENAKNENLNLKGTKLRELGWEKYFEQMQK